MVVEIPEQAFTTHIQVRFDDTDMFGHVNNAKYISWLEAARIEWGRSLQQQFSNPRVRGIMAHVDIDYRGAATIEHEIHISLWITRIGTKSYTTSYLIHNYQQVFATANTVIVAYDFTIDQSIPIPQWYRDLISEFLIES